MSTDQKPEDQITEAAVELDEAQLDGAAGGVIATAPVAASPTARPTTPSETFYEAWPCKPG